MTDEEFKRSLGIHPLDHIKIFEPDTLEYIKNRYPNIEINIDRATHKFGNTYISGKITTTIKFGNKEISRMSDEVSNMLIISMLKELDP